MNVTEIWNLTTTTSYKDYDDISDNFVTELILALVSSSFATMVLICYIRYLIDSGVCKKGFYHAEQYKYESTANTNDLEEDLVGGATTTQETNAELDMAPVKSSSVNQ